MNLFDFLNSLISVILGFGLAVLWDVYKRHTEDNENYRRDLKLIRNEIIANTGLINSDIELLQKDDTSADSNMEVVRPLDRLDISSWTVAYYFRTIFQKKHHELSLRLLNIYGRINIANGRIEARELYRISNGAMTNYHSRRKLINTEIRELLETLRTELGEIYKEVPDPHA